MSLLERETISFITYLVNDGMVIIKLAEFITFCLCPNAALVLWQISVNMPKGEGEKSTMQTSLKFSNKLKLLVLIYCQFVPEISYVNFFAPLNLRLQYEYRT